MYVFSESGNPRALNNVGRNFLRTFNLDLAAAGIARLTMNTYTHLELADTAGAVAALPVI